MEALLWGVWGRNAPSAGFVAATETTNLIGVSFSVRDVKRRHKAFASCPLLDAQFKLPNHRDGCDRSPFRLADRPGPWDRRISNPRRDRGRRAPPDRSACSGRE